MVSLKICRQGRSHREVEQLLHKRLQARSFAGKSCRLDILRGQDNGCKFIIRLLCSHKLGRATDGIAMSQTVGQVDFNLYQRCSFKLTCDS